MAFESKDPVKDLSEGVKGATTTYGETSDGNTGAHRVGNHNQQGPAPGPAKGYNPDYCD